MKILMPMLILEAMPSLQLAKTGDSEIIIPMMWICGASLLGLGIQGLRYYLRRRGLYKDYDEDLI